MSLKLTVGPLRRLTTAKTQTVIRNHTATRIRMTTLLESRNAKFGSANSAIGFVSEGGGSWKVWDRFITVDGERAYHIGNICNTCSFFFERLQGANRAVTVAGVANELTTGLVSLNVGTVEAWGQVLPEGDYVVCLFEILPVLIEPGSTGDYFAREQVGLWGVDGALGKPHDPGTEYFRLGEMPVVKGGQLFEFLVPMFPKGRLKADDLARYTSAIDQGNRPTAVAISVLDVKQPANWEGNPTVTEHWCLAHYLLDGHHKTFAAAQSARPITLLSFFAVGKGLANEAQIGAAIYAFRRDAV